MRCDQCRSVTGGLRGLWTRKGGVVAGADRAFVEMLTLVVCAAFAIYFLVVGGRIQELFVVARAEEKQAIYVVRSSVSVCMHA